MANAKLTWKTITNGTKKVAVTDFGVKYELCKNGTLGWTVSVTVPGHSGLGPQTEFLIRGVSFNEARKAATDDFTRSGGR